MATSIRRRQPGQEAPPPNVAEAPRPAPSWQSQDVQQLLCLPDHLVHHGVWGDWIRARGGLSAIYSYLRALPLTSQDAELLRLYLEQPRAPSAAYMEALHVSRPTYFRRRARLLTTIAAYLNDWPAAPAAQRSGPTPLPTPVTAFFGRERELAQLLELLQQAETRLVTLMGVPGVGKTRLALEAARRAQGRHRDGAAFVSLAALSEPALVPDSIAGALQLPQSGLPAFERLAQALEGRALLLVLDNFEHLLPAAALIGQLLARCPQLTVLCTSRTPLGIYGEHEFPVAPLPVAEQGQLLPLPALLALPSVALLSDRIQAVRPDFRLTAETAPFAASLAAYLEGIPLAIELAASWMKLLSLREACTSITRQLALATEGPRDLPSRQRTLHAAIEWSYQLLRAPERQLFDQLAVFRRGWTVAALEQVCGGATGAPPLVALLEQLRSLINSSLVYVDEQPDGTTRFMMLETIREHAGARLAARADQQAVRRRAAHYYLALAEQGAAALDGTAQRHWMAQLDHEHDNICAALGWLLDQRATELAMRLAVAVGHFWYLRGHLKEGRRWLGLVLAQAGDAGQGELHARLLYRAGSLACSQDDYAEATGLLEASIAMLRQLGGTLLLAQALNQLARVAWSQGELARASQLVQECLALQQQLGDLAGTAASLTNLGLLMAEQGRYDQAAELHGRSLALAREVGNARECANALNNLAIVYTAQSRYAEAQRLLEESQVIYRQLPDARGLASSLVSLGHVLLARGTLAHARATFVESAALCQELGYKVGAADSLAGLACVASAAGRQEEAAWLLGAVEVCYERLDATLYFPHEHHTQHLLDALQARLDQSALREAWAAGRRASVEDALARLRHAAAS